MPKYEGLLKCRVSKEIKKLTDDTAAKRLAGKTVWAVPESLTPVPAVSDHALKVVIQPDNSVEHLKKPGIGRKDLAFTCRFLQPESRDAEEFFRQHKLHAL